MVLLRSLLSAGASSASPVLCRRLLAHSPGYAAVLLPRNLWNFACHHSDARSHSGFQISQTVIDTLPRNWSLSRRCGGKELSLRLQCLGSTASSKEIAISFPVTIEESTNIDAKFEAVVEQLRIDGPLAVELAVEELRDLKDTETVELSLLLCNDAFIQGLNKEWLGKDSPTDVLSFPQDQAPGLTPTLLLGDVIISMDTASRQAEERGHSLLDELRILLVHGLLHVLGHDHELGPEASQAMENKETEILSKLGWKGKGLISSSIERAPEEADILRKAASKFSDIGPDGFVRRPASKPAIKILFCDMDGTLLNSKSLVTDVTKDALKAVMAKGVQVIIATGKTQRGAMAALDPVGLSGDGLVVSNTSPGVFTQGLQVYGRGGRIIHSSVLPLNIVREAFTYSLEQRIPAVGFSGNRIVTLFQTNLTDVLHNVYLEPKAEVIPSVEDLMASCPVQKILFYGTPESIKYQVRPYWTALTKGSVTLVQALDDMLELLPPGQSKGAGVKLLLDHLGVPPEEIMAIGDGENDIEMLELAGWGVAMANGSRRTKEVADAQTRSNDEDGAAEAFHRYILT